MTRCVDSIGMSMPNLLLTSGIALVLPGDAMWGTRQAGFAMRLGERLQEAGHGDQPFGLAIGSSSGSLVATVAAAGAPFDHELMREAFIQFALATRIDVRDGVSNPYPAALQALFDQGPLNMKRAYWSRTQLIVTATHLELGGTQLFAPRYFTNKPTFEADNLYHGAWSLVNGPEQLFQAVQASSRIPGLYGSPVRVGASRFIDGAFANNAPVELALELGAKHVFIVTSGKKDQVFDQPFQSLFWRQVRKALNGTRLEKHIPSSAPVNLDGLRRRYPNSTIHVVHPKNPPRVNRFFESDPEVLRRLYEMGMEEADDITFSRELQPEAVAAS